MPAIRKARALRRGDTVGIAAPAGAVDPERLEEGQDLLREMGFEPYCRKDLLARRGYLAGDDARRADEFMELVESPEVAGIVCARGGYGCHRMVERLDAKAIRKAAKPVMGYSDITTLLLWQRRKAGLMGLHGPMLERCNTLSDDSIQAMSRALTGTGPLPRFEGRSAASGWAEGRLTGGTLSVVVASLGTPWEIDTRDGILLLEETNEASFRIDRMLQQLRAAGKLEALVGIGVGSLEGCGGPEPEDEQGIPTALGVIEEILAPLGVPLVVDLPFGHSDRHFAWPFGARAAIDGARGEIELLEFGVGR